MMISTLDDSIEIHKLEAEDDSMPHVWSIWTSEAGRFKSLSKVEK